MMPLHRQPDSKPLACTMDSLKVLEVSLPLFKTVLELLSLICFHKITTQPVFLTGIIISATTITVYLVDCSCIIYVCTENSECQCSHSQIYIHADISDFLKLFTILKHTGKFLTEKSYKLH
jgi:hypothetical protein